MTTQIVDEYTQGCDGGIEHSIRMIKMRREALISNISHLQWELKNSKHGNEWLTNEDEKRLFGFELALKEFDTLIEKLELGLSKNAED